MSESDFKGLSGQAAIGQMPVNSRGVRPVEFVTIAAGSVQEVAGDIVEEVLVCISVNGKELATFMSSPGDLVSLATGFLYNEQLISGMEDIHSVHLSKQETCVDIWLRDAGFEPPSRKIITAGCGGGVTFDDLSQEHAPLLSGLSATPAQLAGLMRSLHLGAQLYQRARGIHTAVLAEEDRILLQVEDIGRHNCIDRLAGVALRAGIPTRERIMLSSGRISSEMINKARRLETPIICSRTSPTHLSVNLAKAWGITVVAYLRQDRMRIYSHPERIIID